MVRDATGADGAAVAVIYNYYVENTVATFETEPVSGSEMAARIVAISEDYPFLVFEDHGLILGYAYLNRWKNRCAYTATVESTVYVDKSRTRRGIGRALYAELLAPDRTTGCHAVLAGIALPNQASITLHESFGFENVARFRQTGFKYGTWIDVGYWELILEETEK